MNRIAQLRKEKGLNQVGLALRLNVSQYMISSYETGRHQPTEDMLIKIADFFNVSVDYLIGRSDIRYTADVLIENNLTKNEAELLYLFRALTENMKERAIGILFALKNISL